MLKKISFLVSLFFFFRISYSQNTEVTKDSIPLDTFNFSLKNFKGKGQYEFIKKKSELTGAYYQMSLQSGKWEYFDHNEVLRILGNYKVRNEQSFKFGLWEYYDEEGELLMTENYPAGTIPPVFTKPFVRETDDGFDIISENDEGILTLTHYKNPSADIPDPTSRVASMNDSIKAFDMDTLVAMDNRNPDPWLVENIKAKLVSDEVNLVLNPSFERNDGQVRSNGYAIGAHINHWIASSGTPDYYKSTKFNALDGDASIGCRFYTEEGHDIEYISTELKQTLETDQWYCLQVFVRLKGDCFYGVNALGALLSEEIPIEDNLYHGKVKPLIKHHGGSLLSYKTRWMQLGCNFKAKGNETYLTLGSFANTDTMRKLRLKGSRFEAYYFFDAIQLYPVDQPEKCPCSMGKTNQVEPPPPVITTGSSFVIKNIFFDNDQWDLLPQSFHSLDSLYTLLTTLDFKKIEISGHTSSPGSKERNILLSKNRAEAVKAYLVEKGLDEDMFVCKGYGPTKPIADNATEAGQAENRRVEFKILE